MQVTFRAKSSTLTAVFTAADVSISAAFGDRDGRFYAMLGRCYEDEQVVARSELLRAALALRESFERQSHLVGYSYSTEVRLMGREDLKSCSAGGTSGFRIHGEIHSIDSGPGQCNLRRWRLRIDGVTKEQVEEIDVRDQKQIETDDWGPIKILRRKLRLTLPKQLTSLISFLEKIDDDEVTVLAAEKTPTIKELVRIAARDMERAEWAEEQLYNLGDKARQELLMTLSDNKQRRLHAKVTWLLLTLFPSAESRVAVERRVETEGDEQSRRELLMVLAAVPPLTTQ